MAGVAEAITEEYINQLASEEFDRSGIEGVRAHYYLAARDLHTSRVGHEHVANDAGFLAGSNTDAINDAFIVSHFAGQRKLTISGNATIINTTIPRSPNEVDERTMTVMALRRMVRRLQPPVEIEGLAPDGTPIP